MNELKEFFSKLFNYSDWFPLGHDDNWSSFHRWLYIISSLLICLACSIISIVIIKYIIRKKDLKFIKLYFLLAIFILALGAINFLNALAFQFPFYRFNTLLLFITSIISWVTLYYLLRFLPLGISIKSLKIVDNEIAQRKAMEAELIESEEKLQTIYKNAPDAVIMISSAGRIIIWNPAAEKMFGWKEEEVVGKILNDIIVPKEARQGYIDEMKIFLKTGDSRILRSPIMQTMFRKDHSSIKVEFTVSQVKVKNDYLIIGFVRDATEKIKAAEALKESEERYRLLTTEVYDYAIILLSPEGNIISWNEGAQRIKGYTESEIIGKNFSIFYSVEDRKNNFHLQQLDIAVKEGRCENEGWRVKKNGTFFWANVVITALKRNGVLIGFSKITRDSTERKKSEELIQQSNTSLEQRVVERTVALQQSEKKYRKLFENSPMPMWVIDLPSLKFLDVNEAAIIHYGYTRKEFLSMTAHDIRPDDEKKRFVEFNHAPSNGLIKTGTWKHLKKDGSIIYAEVNSHKMTIDDNAARLVLSVDITDRKKAEDRLDFALEAGQIGVWEIDLINDTSVRSLRHDQIFGYQEILPEWNFKTFMAHIHPEDLMWVQDSFKEALITQNSVIETRIIWQDLSTHWVLINGKIILDNKDRPLKMLGTIIDISNQKKAEASIRELNNELEQRVEVRTKELNVANKEMESFSYSVSHDLRAPLRAIHGYSQILQEDYQTKLDAEGNRLLSRIMFNAKKMGRLIDDLLEFSRLGKKPLNKTTVDINKIVKDIVEELSQTNKYHHNIIIGQLGTAFADVATIQVVFENLLSNATKYSSKKENPVVEVGVVQKENDTVYFIKDNGAGFNMAYYDKLFAVFQRFHSQEEFEGTGVGLAIVQRIIVKHGGKIWAESILNEGATFYFTLQ